MNRKAFILLSFLLISFSLFSRDINFSGGRSSLSLKEGEKNVLLENVATVTTGSITIKSDSMKLYGEDWRYVECSKNVVIVDNEKGIEIRTNNLWYDRLDEIIIISTWFEIDDNEQNLYAEAGSLHYNMKDEILELAMNVSLLRVSDNSVMTCTSEALTYRRVDEYVTLKGKSEVVWKGDNYSADVISVDLKNDEITLSGRIRGTING